MTLTNCDSVCCMLWHGLEQSLIGDAVDQWPTCLLLVFVPLADISNMSCDCQFVLTVLELYGFTPRSVWR